jgi:HSP20 family protein
MSTAVARYNYRPAGSLNGAGTVGYVPFRRFFTTSDPAINVVRTETGFDVEIPVPGYSPENVEITVKDDVLTIAGKTERKSFTRSLRLPEDIDGASADAVVENGLLSLRLQRHPEAEPQKIAIKAHRDS